MKASARRFPKGKPRTDGYIQRRTRDVVLARERSALGQSSVPGLWRASQDERYSDCDWPLFGRGLWKSAGVGELVVPAARRLPGGLGTLLSGCGQAIAGVLEERGIVGEGEECDRGQR